MFLLLPRAQLVTVQEAQEQAVRDAGLPPDDPLNLDPLGASRKLRARGENNKVQKTLKKKNAIPWNHGYIVRANQLPNPQPASLGPLRAVFGTWVMLTSRVVVGWVFSSVRSSCGRMDTVLKAARVPTAVTKSPSDRR